MREIKFRQYVWDDDSKTNGRMVSWEELLQEENESLVANFTQKFSNASELMQYTGLDDKNGVELFEGDILECEFSSERFVVEFDAKTAQFTTKSNWLWSILDRCEVIGNIYDNPHDNPGLLESKP